mgnify:CR=1 FL=1
MVGRRLSDGVAMPEPSSGRLRWVVSTGLLLLAACSCPSHEAFTAYLSTMAQHPSGLLGGLSAVVESVHISVAATSSWWLLFRIGRFRSDPYLGVFGTWFPLPSLDAPWASLDLRLPSSLPRAPWDLVCSDGRTPHESFLLLCVAGFAMWHLAPRTMYRHAVCSVRAVQAGRVWGLLTANASHASAFHLLHNALQLMHFGTILHAALGCDRLTQLRAPLSKARGPPSVRPEWRHAGSTSARGCPRLPQAPASLGASAACAAHAGQPAAKPSVL